jgi:hypothetical protein
MSAVRMIINAVGAILSTFGTILTRVDKAVGDKFFI